MMIWVIKKTFLIINVKLLNMLMTRNSIYFTYTAGEISIDHFSSVNMFLKMLLTCSPDAGNNPSNPCIHISSEIKIYVTMYLVFCTKVFEGKDSFKMPRAGETGHVCCSNPEGVVTSSVNSDL